MPTFILSKNELDVILEVLADKVKNISQQKPRPDDFGNYYSVFSKIFSFTKEDASKREKKKAALLNSRIADSGLDTRSKNALLAEGIIHIKDMAVLSIQIIKNYRNLGKGSAMRIEKFLGKNGLEFGMQLDGYFLKDS